MIRPLLPAGVLVAGAVVLAATDGPGDPAFGRRLADDIIAYLLSLKGDLP